MQLSSLGGNPRLKSQFAEQKGGRYLSHAYIVAGRIGSGRHALVRDLAAAALCVTEDASAPCGQCNHCKKVYGNIHPDIIEVGEDKPLPVDAVRELRKDVYIRPNEGVRKVYILWNADKMNDSGQNALLKVLEEGPSYALFILVAENEGGILETLRSRSERISLAPAEEQVDEQIVGYGQQIVSAVLSQNELSLLEVMTSFEKLEKEQITKLFANLQGELTHAVLRSDNPKLTQKAAQLCTKMQEGARQNVGVPQLMGWYTAALFG